jgi:5,10-methylenetetrahydrofolate reductase
VSVEVNPAPGLSTEKPVAVARMLREAGVDVVNIADGPRATVRMSNTALAEAIQREVLEGTQLIAAF